MTVDIDTEAQSSHSKGKPGREGGNAINFGKYRHRKLGERKWR